MKKEYTTEKRSETRTYHEFTELNAKGEKIAFEFVRCENLGGKNSLPYLWKKNGYIDRILETYWSVSTFATDAPDAGEDITQLRKSAMTENAWY